MKTADIRPNPKNPRRIDTEALDRLKSSIQRDPQFMELRPIVVDADGMILGGNMRYRAIQALGMDEMPDRWVVRAENLTPEQQRRFILVDNAPDGMSGSWVAEILADEWDIPELGDLGFDVEAMGLLEDVEEGGRRITEDEVPEVPDEPTTKPGDLWLLGEHRLLCGDATNAEDVARLMSAERWRLCVTSPPYNQKTDTFSPTGMHRESGWVKNVQRGSYPDNKPEDEYQADQAAAIQCWIVHAAPNASIFYNHKNRYRDKQVVSPWQWLSKTGLRIRQEIIWHRPGSVTQNARMFLPCDERIFWLYCGDDFFFDDTTEHKTWSSVWKIAPHMDRSGESQHGCAFPVELAARPICACSECRDVVLEPYCGSGTTLIAAEQLGRRCYAMEIEPRYVDVALQRYVNLTGKTPVNESTGEEWRT